MYDTNSGVFNFLQAISAKLTDHVKLSNNLINTGFPMHKPVYRADICQFQHFKGGTKAIAI